MREWRRYRGDRQRFGRSGDGLNELNEVLNDIVHIHEAIAVEVEVGLIALNLWRVDVPEESNAVGEVARPREGSSWSGTALSSVARGAP